MAEQAKQPGNTAIDLRAYHPLAKMRWIIRAYVLMEGVVLALILACIWFWFAVALDFSLHYFKNIDLVDRGFPLRWIALTVFATGMAGILFWYVARRLFRDFRPTALALVLEQRFPKLLGGRLITAIELVNLKRAAKQGYSVEMIVKTMRDAKERVDRVPIRSVFNWGRLVLFAWTLIGVSLFTLLLIYPISALVAVIEQERGPTFAVSLIFNSLLILGIAFVFIAPCVFLWLRKNRSKWRWALLGVAALCAAATGVSYGYALNRINSLGQYEYSWGLYHGTKTSVHRNFLFKDEFWPRDEYFVDWLDFPVAEKRIQSNKTINARAYFTTWIIADEAAPKRWRPLKWSDLPQVVDQQQIPNLPLEQIHAFLVGLTGGDERSPVGYDAANVSLPSRDEIPVDLALAAINFPGQVHVTVLRLNPTTLRLDRVEVDAPQMPIKLSDEERGRFAALAEALDAAADDVERGGRLIRKVTPPAKLKFHYGNEQSRLAGDSDLVLIDGTRSSFALQEPVRLNDSFVVVSPEGQANQDTSTEQDRKVPVHVGGSVNGEPVQTSTKSVVLVQPAVIQTLAYQEFRPAYFYYLPPTAPRAVTIDERRRLLRDLRQTMPKMNFNLPPEFFEIPNLTLGSELVVTATADKPLRDVTLVPRGLDFPSLASKEDVLPLPLRIEPDGKSFTISFASNGRPFREWLKAKSGSSGQNPIFPLINKPVTFDVVMTDVDNMPSSRSFMVKPLDDKLPNVSLFVDVVRQAQMDGRTVFVCTGKAELPLTKESSVSDDVGLHKVEFAYRYMPLANQAVVSVRAEMAAWLFASTPVLPNIGDYLYRREVLQRTISAAKGPAPIEGTTRLDAFDNAQARYAERGILRLEDLKPLLAAPLKEGYSSPVLKKFEFKESDSPVVFDLMQRLPGLTQKDAFGVVPNYELTLDVKATDANVLVDFDRIGENKEAPLVFRIISEQDLNVFIEREQADLIRRFDEMINQLEKSQRILQDLDRRLGSLSNSTSTSEQTRIEGIMDTVAKSLERTAETYRGYERIQREYRLNRFPNERIDNLDKIVRPLKSVQEREFPVADAELVQFHAILREGQPATAQPKSVIVIQNMQNLINSLKDIMNAMGRIDRYNKVLAALKGVIDGQTQLSAEDLKKIELQLRRDLLHIQIFPEPSTVSVNAGEATKVKLRLRMPDTITSDPVLRFEIPTNSGIKLATPEIRLQEDANEAVFVLTAGIATGTFHLKINPSQGDPVELKVIVK